MERLEQLCAQNRCTPPAELLKKVFAGVEAFSGGREPEDDMAATVFHSAG